MSGCSGGSGTRVTALASEPAVLGRVAGTGISLLVKLVSALFVGEALSSANAHGRGVVRDAPSADTDSADDDNDEDSAGAGAGAETGTGALLDACPRAGLPSARATVASTCATRFVKELPRSAVVRLPPPPPPASSALCAASKQRTSSTAASRACCRCSSTCALWVFSMRIFASPDVQAPKHSFRLPRRRQFKQDTKLNGWPLAS